MRYYLVGPENKEITIDLIRTTRRSAHEVEYDFQAVDAKGVVRNTKKVYLKKLAFRYFVSNNGTHWERITKQDLPDHILNVNEVFKLYRGYKPSGLSSGEEGELVTQMPGKVIKIIKSVGDKVAKGETVLLLEAMKMENEIKSNTDGTIRAIHIEEGQTLDENFLMMEIEKS